jgi:hypothetical protein
LLTKRKDLGVAETPLLRARNTRWKASFIKSLSKQGNKERQLDANGFGDMQKCYIASNI